MNLLPAGPMQESSAGLEEPVLVQPCLCCPPELLPGANDPLNCTQVCLSKGAHVSKGEPMLDTNTQSADDWGTHTDKQTKAQNHSAAQSYPVTIPQRSLEQRGAVTPARDGTHQ